MIKKLLMLSCVFGIGASYGLQNNARKQELCDQFAQFSPKIQTEIIYKMNQICITLELLEKHKEKFKKLYEKDKQNDSHQNAMEEFSKKEVYYFKLLPLFNIKDQSEYIKGKISDNHGYRCPIFLIESPESLSFIKTFLETTGFFEHMSNHEKFISELLGNNTQLTTIKRNAKKCYACCLQKLHEQEK
jgi:hypothetical protein